MRTPPDCEARRPCHRHRIVFRNTVVDLGRRQRRACDNARNKVGVGASGKCLRQVQSTCLARPRLGRRRRQVPTERSIVSRLCVDLRHTPHAALPRQTIRVPENSVGRTRTRSARRPEAMRSRCRGDGASRRCRHHGDCPWQRDECHLVGDDEQAGACRSAERHVVATTEHRARPTLQGRVCRMLPRVRLPRTMFGAPMSTLRTAPG